MTLRCDLLLPSSLHLGERAQQPEEDAFDRIVQEEVADALQDAFFTVRKQLPFHVDFRKVQIADYTSATTASMYQWKNSHMIIAPNPDQHLLMNLQGAAIENPALSLMLYGNDPLPDVQVKILRETIPNAEDRLCVRCLDYPLSELHTKNVQLDIKKSLQFICAKYFG